MTNTPTPEKIARCKWPVCAGSQPTACFLCPDRPDTAIVKPLPDGHSYHPAASDSECAGFVEGWNACLRAISPSIRPDGEMVERVAKAIAAQDRRPLWDTMNDIIKEHYLGLATAALQVQAQGGWMPIESAPKDGRVLIAGGTYFYEHEWRQFVGPAFVWWNPSEEGWARAGVGGAGIWHKPEAWFDLPAPPESQHNTGER